jgi:hypothetical protein
MKQRKVPVFGEDYEDEDENVTIDTKTEEQATPPQLVDGEQQ